jgi:hypothetical protein
MSSTASRRTFRTGLARTTRRAGPARAGVAARTRRPIPLLSDRWRTCCGPAAASRIHPSTPTAQQAMPPRSALAARLRRSVARTPPAQRPGELGTASTPVASVIGEHNAPVRSRLLPICSPSPVWRPQIAGFSCAPLRIARIRSSLQTARIRACSGFVKLVETAGANRCDIRLAADVSPGTRDWSATRNAVL